jgi:hypothetical protein
MSLIDLLIESIVWLLDGTIRGADSGTSLALRAEGGVPPSLGIACEMNNPTIRWMEKINITRTILATIG